MSIQNIKWLENHERFTELIISISGRLISPKCLPEGHRQKVLSAIETIELTQAGSLSPLFWVGLYFVFS